MKIIISNISDEPIYEQIYRQIKRAIIMEDVKDGEKLASIRELAKEVRVSVITIKKAYEKLEGERLIYTLKGKGSYVNHRESSQIISRELEDIGEDMKKIVDRGRLIGLGLDDLLEILKSEYGGNNNG